MDLAGSGRGGSWRVGGRGPGYPEECGGSPEAPRLWRPGGFLYWSKGEQRGVCCLDVGLASEEGMSVLDGGHLRF